MDILKAARSMAHILMGKYTDQKITTDLILEEIQNIKTMPGFGDLDQDELVAQLEGDFDVHVGEATFLVNDEIVPWVANKESEIDWQLWDRYRSYMQLKDSSFPIDNLDDLTKKILDKCVDPTTPGDWDRRGMVVGHVQSGKTSNYIGLINKATDAGYKLIIVIAGVHNSLRAQTQKRIDSGFTGMKSSDFFKGHNKKGSGVKIGVGEFEVDTEIFPFTSSEEKGDFNKIKASGPTIPIGKRNPVVFVIKKNKSVLESLITWLARYSTEEEGLVKKIKNIPLLVIDDEADNASVNSGKDVEDIRTINRLIRTLLNLFQKNTFIGYTATPYANLFIPDSWSKHFKTEIEGNHYHVGEDLFPRDFIVNIPAPSNYIGASKIFGYDNQESGESYDGLPIIRWAEDQEPHFPKKINKKNSGDLPDDIPKSLQTAIMSFIMTCAIRRTRGQKTKHNSMLIHVALRVAWIDRIASLVNSELRSYKRQIKSGEGPLLRRLQQLFENDFVPTTEDIIESFKAYNDHKLKVHSWDEVKKELIHAVAKIEVRAVHGQKNTRGLEYADIEEINYDRYKDQGFSVIAVGGNRLARGITLEGLSVSYYLRTSRMYDSLMQMGRWFGYRPGYVDLCRLFTTNQLVSWYRHVTVATEEMRDDFDEMAAQTMKPSDYKLKVRTHSGLLSITSASKMKEFEKIKVGFSGDIKQTYSFEKNGTTIQHNLEIFKDFLSKLPNPNSGLESGSLIKWENVSPTWISEFILNYKTSQPNIRPTTLAKYILTQVKNGKMRNWTVALFSNSAKDIIIRDGNLENGKWVVKKDQEGNKAGERKAVKKYSFKIGQNQNREIGLAIRNDLQSPQNESYGLTKNAIMDPKHFYLDLDLTPENGKKHPSKSAIREQRAKEQKGLLMFYALDPRGTYNIDNAVPIIGFGICFPKIKDEEQIEFAARPVKGFEDSLDFEESEVEEY